MSSYQRSGIGSQMHTPDAVYATEQLPSQRSSHFTMSKLSGKRDRDVDTCEKAHFQPSPFPLTNFGIALFKKNQKKPQKPHSILLHTDICICNKHPETKLPQPKCVRYGQVHATRQACKAQSTRRLVPNRSCDVSEWGGEQKKHLYVGIYSMILMCWSGAF